MPSEHTRFLDDFDMLIKSGVVGLFDHFELIEIVQYTDNVAKPINIFTIAVALENGEESPTEKLNDERIRLTGFKNSFFGVFRSILSVDTLRAALQSYLTTQTWKPGDVDISVGQLKPTAKRFVPVNGSIDVPLNQVLKNNFFNGSYVLELFDVGKLSFQDFFNKPAALQQLSKIVSGIVPLRIAGLSDRLGNLIIQFPIEAIRANFGSNGSIYTAEIAWHQKIPERDLLVTVSAVHDKSLISFGQEKVRSGLVALCTDLNYGLLHGSVWDRKSGILLAATTDQAFINTMMLNTAMGTHEPRMLPESMDAQEATVRIKLSEPPTQSLIGRNPKVSITEPIRKRVYEEELASLERQRKFIQYAAKPHSGASDRQRALNDVRSLITSYGANGVWLWDPFLAPQDILNTLFHNPSMGAPMKALTLLKVPADDHVVSSVVHHEHYNTVLSGLPGNYHGLNIEFRSAHGPRGWNFHDRFLIFPKSKRERAKVWSLGTSVNSLGKSHHILQQVEHAQLIADAFQSLWDAIDHCGNVIWKCP